MEQGGDLEVQLGVRALIRAGEGPVTEFKSSLRYDRQSLNANRELPKAVARAIAGFMNTEGGHLLIGVGDDQSITGIEDDLQTLRRKDRDGFERSLRASLATHLGPEVTPSIAVTFEDIEGLTIALVFAPAWPRPVYMSDGDRSDFYVRDGNGTQQLDVRTAHEYIEDHWPRTITGTREEIAAIVLQMVRSGIATAAESRAGSFTDELTVPSTVERLEENIAPEDFDAGDATESIRGQRVPPWLRIGTRRVLNLFLGQLSLSSHWDRIYIISPWISDLDEGAAISFDFLVQRLEADETTVYVVTRPPEEPWHESAVSRLGATGRANIALVPGLHAKLFAAQTKEGSFALLGSANFTQQSLANREIGLLVNAYMEGRSVVRNLIREASAIYRTPGRRLAHRASFAR